MDALTLGHRRLQSLLHRPVVQALVAAAEEAGGGRGSGRGPLHLVGGALRDRWLGLPTHDLDAVVAGGAEAIARRLAESPVAEGAGRWFRLGGERFAAYRVLLGEVTVDLWDRGETSLLDDLARRDLTINSFALDPVSGQAVDPFGGLRHLQRRLLVATRPDAFSEDPLRVLRLPRLALQLPGFAAAPATLELAREASPEISEVASERVRDELERIFASDEAHRGVALLAALDLYPGLWLGSPGTGGAALDGMAAGGRTIAGRAVRLLEQLAIERRRLARRAPAAAGALDIHTARLALTFLALPAERAAAALDGFAGGGYITRRRGAEVGTLIGCRRLPGRDGRPGVGVEAGERRRFLHAAGDLWPSAIAVAATCAAIAERPVPPAELDRLADLMRRHGRQILEPPRLIGGNEAAELLGIEPGPDLGRALAALKRRQVEGKISNREEAESFLASYSEAS